ncbi:MAG TPA: TIGR03435 family protein [Bryobacteraceae bacterium]|jgi:uncharacterized protein (TIGR03435 family)
MRRIIPAFFAVLLPFSAFAQKSSAPEFDIADVHVSLRGDWVKTTRHAMQGGFLAGDRYDVTRATMLDLIQLAYRVAPDKIYGGPSWLDYDRFEIRAKTKRGTSDAVLRQLLQQLLESRFALAVRTDQRGAPGYQLRKSQTEWKPKPSDVDAAHSGCQQVGPLSRDGATRITNVQCRAVTMASLAESLRRLFPSQLGDLTIADATGTEGHWDLDLPIPARAQSAADAGLIEALDKVGLKLERSTISQPTLSVESVNETPSANPPGIESSLPPLPAPQFEVAAIRPCTEGYTGAPRFEPGGRVTAICMPLVSLIRDAYNLLPAQTLIGMPKWTTTARNITIVAQAPADSSPNLQDASRARETLNAMLRTLLADRYKLAAHYEDRPVDAQTLVAVKPKLTKADPSTRTGCVWQNLNHPDGKLWKHWTCQNMTMSQFAEQLQELNPDLAYPVLDGTGIEGAWDFSLEWDLDAALSAILRGVTGSIAQVGDAADPSGTVTFETALEKQLGLKLETHKRPEPQLIIDHLEEKPTEN